MADPKSKNTNGNHANGNHVSDKTSPKQSKLRQLLTLAKEVSKDAEAIQDYEKSVEGRKALEQELEAKQGENQRLRELNDKVMRDLTDQKSQASAASAASETLVATFEQKFKTYESNKAAVEAMEAEVAEVRKKLAASDAAQKGRDGELEKLKQRVKTFEDDEKSHFDEMREMNAECELHRSRMQASDAELEGCKKKLVEAQSDLGEGILRKFGLEELKKLRHDLADLLEKIHGFVNEYFNDHDGAEDSASEILELSIRFPKIPLSTRTTRAAAKMRCAVADAVIAETLLAHVFVPFYVPNEIKTTASAMLDFFEGDERRQTVYRCQILGSVSDSEQGDQIREDIVRKASNEVRSTLHPLVVAYKQAGFYNAGPSLFRQAVGLWADAQCSHDLITADVPDDEEAGQHKDYDPSSTDKPATNTKSSALAVLFPQVVNRSEVIFEGVVLKSDQGTVLEAREEMRANGTPKKKTGTRRRSSAGPDAPPRR
ncbi:hypothetical protein Neosp_004153 [[Neocosmospora] mangrovei]